MSHLGAAILIKLKTASHNYHSQTEMANKIQVNQSGLNSILNEKKDPAKLAVETFEKMLPILDGIEVFIDGEQIGRSTIQQISNGSGNNINTNDQSTVNINSTTKDTLNQIEKEILDLEDLDLRSILRILKKHQ